MSAVRRNGWLVGLVMVGWGVVLAGCTTPVPTEAEIVGTWVGESPDGWGEPGGTMVFNADGTFIADGVPEGVLDRTRDTTGIDGEGTWTVDDGSFGDSPNYYDPGVQIHYSPVPPATGLSRLVFTKSHGTLHLTYWNNYDLPERYIFEKDE